MEMERLPEELIGDEILTRIPIKSLVRFFSVSKSWQSIILNPEFVDAHLTHNIKQNPSYYDNLIALTSSNGVRIISRYNRTRTYLLPFQIYSLIGSINGLVCVYRLGKFWLWNPVIYKFKEIMPRDDKNLYRETRKSDEYALLLGFGWDRLRKDFKLVSCYLSARLKKCVVYSSNSDSWTELVMEDSVFPKYLYRSERIVLTPAIIVKNCPYWRYSNILSRKQRNHVQHNHWQDNHVPEFGDGIFYGDEIVEKRNYDTLLVKFEVESNEFRLLPEFDYDIFEGKKFDFVNIKDCLAAIVYRDSNERGSTIGSLDIYTLDEVSCVIRKLYTVGPINFDLPILKFSQGFKYGGEIVFSKAGKLFCYDPETDVVGILGSSSFRMEDYFVYTPTLAFLPGMKMVKYFDGT